MNADKFANYAFSMLLLQLSFVLIGLSGVFPYSLELAGFDVYGDIQDSITSIQTMYEGVSQNGALTAIAISGMILLMGVKILLEFALLTLTGAYPLMVGVGLPVAFALPISVFLGAVCIYGLSIKFMGR